MQRYLNEKDHPGNDEQKCRDSVGDEFSITCLQAGTRLVVRRRHGHHYHDDCVDES